MITVAVPGSTVEIVRVLGGEVPAHAEPFHVPTVQLHVVPTAVTPLGNGFCIPENGELVQRSGWLTVAVAALEPAALVALSV